MSSGRARSGGTRNHKLLDPIDEALGERILRLDLFPARRLDGSGDRQLGTAANLILSHVRVLAIVEERMQNQAAPVGQLVKVVQEQDPLTRRLDKSRPVARSSGK